ncbi:MAG: NUDIX domain-containing protein [Clostridiales bacterium]|nr:NUDIX domain-containing protein [Clostridiales bacterium]
MTTYEYSCGAVVFTRGKGLIRYVIIESRDGYFGFPKGHMEKGETAQETALREIFEETGLRPRILPGFQTTAQHPIPWKENTIKHITYFLAEYENQKIVYQEQELRSARLLTYEEAMAIFQFEESKAILTQAHQFLLKLE